MNGMDVNVDTRQPARPHHSLHGPKLQGLKLLNRRSKPRWAVPQVRYGDEAISTCRQIVQKGGYAARASRDDVVNTRSVGEKDPVHFIRSK
jgi:hypothetical protein